MNRPFDFQMDGPFGFRVWLTDWFGPAGTRFENIVWPVLGLFVLAAAGGVIGTLLAIFAS